MKEWRPDRQFKKADFPVKKKGDEKDRTARQSDSHSSPPGRSRPGTEQPSEPKKAENQQPLKGWSVPKLGGGHVIAGGSSKSKPGSVEPADSPDSAGTLRLSGEATSSSLNSDSAGSAATTPASGNREAEQKKDMTRVYLSQLVGQDPRAATDILRSWYWEKPGRESPVKYIPPKNRIHLILRSLSKEALLALYEMMTPVERRQMEEIRKEPMHVNDREILKLRQYFMARMTGQI
ncbi:MAG TPA: hypothetical protein DEA96_16840 [Leptospiraceae bacterium]|nr:hypothetical protein [Spirochaetaceae bacterium]HBS06639.1 hypothetical protein [Leptospiraceae bacterium]|tara:strand:- start:139713 stop:140417 length:705 start_codon:yes stop_codon:yes gene_type:complete